MNFVVNTGNVQRDHEEIARYQQHYRAQGLEVYVQPMQSGGFQLTVAPAQQAPAAAPQYGAPEYGAPPQQPAAPPGPYGAAYAMAGAGPMAGGVAGDAAPPLTQQRVAYLRKVYGLLTVSAFLAVFSGWASVTLGPTVAMTSSEGQ